MRISEGEHGIGGGELQEKRDLCFCLTNKKAGLDSRTASTSTTTPRTSELTALPKLHDQDRELLQPKPKIRVPNSARTVPSNP